MKGFSIHLGPHPLKRRNPQDYAEFVRYGLRSLTMADRWAYRDDPSLPSIYDAPVVYRREAPGHEQFCGVRTVLERGYGDCEDLACALAAWYAERRGELAVPHITWRPLGRGAWLYHITVRRADGRIEDPSRELGMGREPGAWVRRGRRWIYELEPSRRGELAPPPQPVIERTAA